MVAPRARACRGRAAGTEGGPARGAAGTEGGPARVEAGHDALVPASTTS